MANWCKNSLMIGGKTTLDVFNDIKSLSTVELIDFERILPYVDDTTWGTPLNATGSVSVIDTPNEITMTFLTDATPPIPVITKLSELYPEYLLILDYVESGSAYTGIYTIKNNVVIDDLPSGSI